MPFGLGFFATAGAGGAAGSFDLLESQVLTGSQASVTFSNLNSTYGATYQHLQIRATIRTTRASFPEDIFSIRLNSDTGASYAHHVLACNGSSDSSGSDINITRGFVTYVAGATATANLFTGVVLDLLDPFETTKFKTMRYLSGYGAGDRLIGLGSNLWRSTNAVTTITLDSVTAANLAQYSRFSLYGIRAV